MERASIDEAYIDLTDVVNERMLIANQYVLLIQWFTVGDCNSFYKLSQE